MWGRRVQEMKKEEAKEFSTERTKAGSVFDG
jgi:hypothetical protein